MLSVPPVPFTFSSWVGINDEVGDQGHAEFRVYADGTTRSRPLAGQ
jgi:hypothetical protein